MPRRCSRLQLELRALCLGRCTVQLLRAGARVVATTRFPKDALQRYALEADFASWKERLLVLPLDLLNLK